MDSFYGAVPFLVVQDEVIAFGEKSFGFAGGGDEVEEILDGFPGDERIVRGVEHEDRNMELGRSRRGFVDELLDLGKEPHTEGGNEVRGVLHLPAMGGVAGDLDFAITEGFEGNLLAWQEIQRGPEGEVFQESQLQPGPQCHHRRAEDNARWGDSRDLAGSGMNGNEGTQALAIPINRDAFVAVFHQRREVFQIVQPLLAGFDIAPLFHVRIVALPTELQAVDGITSSRQALAYGPEVAGRAAQAVDADDDTGDGFRSAGPCGKWQDFSIPGGPAGGSHIHALPGWTGVSGGAGTLHHPTEGQQGKKQQVAEVGTHKVDSDIARQRARAEGVLAFGFMDFHPSVSSLFFGGAIGIGAWEHFTFTPAFRQDVLAIHPQGLHQPGLDSGGAGLAEFLIGLLRAYAISMADEAENGPAIRLDNSR